ALDGSYITAEDVGTSSRDMVTIAHETRHVVGLPRVHGGSGDPSPFTAAGVLVAMRASAQRRLGSSDLDGRRIAIVGCGRAGGAATNQLADEALADTLAGRDILYAPDFIANAGGLMNVALDLHGYDEDLAHRQVEGIREVMERIYAAAEAEDITPLAAAYVV